MGLGSHGMGHLDLYDVHTPHTATEIADAVLSNTQISATAAIAFSKLATLTSAYILVGSSDNVATAVAVSGDISIDNAGAVAIASGVIVDADVNSAAAIQASKILVSGSTTLASWRKSTDLTKIDGAQISAGTIAAAALTSLIAMLGYYDLSLWDACVYG